MSAFFVVSIIQGAAIIADELIFHRKRGLPRWERIGHPIDTLSVIACLLFLALIDRTPLTENIFIGMAAFSCILVSKDEWVHRKLCSAEEMWLHAILFMMHPLLLFTAYREWERIRSMLLLVSAGISCFLVYQVVYWNFIDVKIRKARQDRHYKPARQEDLYEYFSE